LLLSVFPLHPNGRTTSKAKHAKLFITPSTRHPGESQAPYRRQNLLCNLPGQYFLVAHGISSAHPAYRFRLSFLPQQQGGLNEQGGQKVSRRPIGRTPPQAHSFSGTKKPLKFPHPINRLESAAWARALITNGPVLCRTSSQQAITRLLAIAEFESDADGPVDTASSLENRCKNYNSVNRIGIGLLKHREPRGVGGSGLSRCCWKICCDSL